ncbi:MAG: hypothetical protein KF775_00930 [Cyclobacteriaceae bacterium]|nr:hypothetical protein [Cyclobacteriaceae bacterium]
MKRILLIIIFLSSYHLWAQMPKDPETGKFTYKEVFELPGTDDQLYFRLRQWLAYNNWYVEIEQPEHFRLQARFRYMDVSTADALLSLGSSNRNEAGREIHAALILEAKDGKIRCTFTDFRQASLIGARTSWGIPDATYIPLEDASLSKGIIKRGGEVMPKYIEYLKIYMNRKLDEW